MNQRRRDRVERRRPAVDLNMGSETGKLTNAPKGLLALLRRLFGGTGPKRTGR